MMAGDICPVAACMAAPSPLSSSPSQQHHQQQHHHHQQRQQQPWDKAPCMNGTARPHASHGGSISISVSPGAASIATTAAQDELRMISHNLDVLLKSRGASPPDGEATRLLMGGCSSGRPANLPLPLHSLSSAPAALGDCGDGCGSPSAQRLRRLRSVELPRGGSEGSGEALLLAVAARSSCSPPLLSLHRVERQNLKHGSRLGATAAAAGQHQGAAPASARAWARAQRSASSPRSAMPWALTQLRQQQGYVGEGLAHDSCVRGSAAPAGLTVVGEEGSVPAGRAAAAAAAAMGQRHEMIRDYAFEGSAARPPPPDEEHCSLDWLLPPPVRRQPTAIPSTSLGAAAAVAAPTEAPEFEALFGGGGCGISTWGCGQLQHHHHQHPHAGGLFTPSAGLLFSPRDQTGIFSPQFIRLP